MKELRLLIREKREEKKISQQTLADKIGVQQMTINQFETGRHEIGSSKLDKIFRVLGIELK